MKRLLFLILTLIILSPYRIFPQWILKHSYPEYFEGINCLYFLDAFNAPATGFAVDNAGKILKTTNGGDTWRYIQSVPMKALYAITFIDSLTGFCVGNSGVVLSTIDQGIHWETVVINTSADLRTIIFTGDSIGYIGGKSIILKTANRGKTWNSIRIDSTVTFSKIVFDPSGAGYVLQSNSKIYKTTDSGITWSMTNSGPWAMIKDIFFTSVDTGYAVGGGLEGKWQTPKHFILKTVDGGKDWFVLLSYLGIIQYEKVWFANSDSGFIFADRGDIHFTSDRGVNWINVPPTIGSITGLYMTKGGNIYTGNINSIAASTSRALPWKKYISNLASTITSFHFSDSRYGLASSTLGKIFETNDGGENWRSIDKNYFQTQIINSVYRLSDTSYLAFTNSSVYRLSNDDQQWTNRMDSLSGPTSCHFPTLSTGYIVDISGTVFKTTDSGLSWKRLSQNLGTHLQHVWFINSDTGFIGAAYQQLFTTTNGGQTWTKRTFPYDFWVTKIQFISSEVGFLQCGSIIYKTVNGGIDWSVTSTYPYYHYSEKIEFVDSLNWYAVFDHFFRTSDGGKTWRDVPLDKFISTGQLFRSIYFVSKDTGFIGGNDGMILKTTNAGGIFTSVIPNNKHLPIEYVLEQNYPNPFNPSTRIGFSLPASGFVSINVFDALGRKVAVLINGQLSAGKHSIDFSPSNLSAGVYYYRMVSNFYSTSKKMLFVK